MACLCICRDLTMESWTSGGESLHCSGGKSRYHLWCHAQGEAEMASNGLLISSSKGNPYVVAAASSLGADGQILCRRSGSRAAGN